MRFFKWKSELLGLAITASLFGLGMGVRPLMDWVRSTDDQTLVIVGDMPAAEQFERLPLTVEQQPMEEMESAMARLASGDIEAIASWQDADASTRLTVMREPGWLAEFEAVASRQALPEKLQRSPISAQQLESLLAPAPTVVDYHPQAPPVAGRLQKLLGMFAIGLPVMGVFSAFSYFFVSITAEKQNRLGEQLLSAVGESAWLDGKLLGLTALCMKSMLTISLMGVAGIALFLHLGEKTLDGGYINWLNVVWAGLFCLLSIAFWSAVMAAIAATISDPNSSARSSLMLLPGLFMLMPVLALDIPDSFGVALLSVLPVTSTAFMPVRLVLSDVPMWQVFLSVVGMIGTIALVRLAARRVLKMSMVMYGREPGLAEIIKAIRSSSSSQPLEKQPQAR